MNGNLIHLLDDTVHIIGFGGEGILCLVIECDVFC
jgi:hypothetical protein